jgi:hypothetical protein
MPEGPIGRGVSPLAGGRGLVEATLGQVERSESVLTGLLKIIPNPTCVYDSETFRLLEVNDAFVERYGHSRIELLAMTMSDLWLPGHAPSPANRRPGAGEPALQRHRRKDGTVMAVATRSTSLVYGGREACVLIAQEASDDHGSGDELRRQAAFFRQVIDLIPSLVFAKDRQSRFTLGNQAVADLYGTTVGGLLGKTDAELAFRAADAEVCRKSDLEAMDSGAERRVAEERFTDSRGNLRWLQTVKRPIRSDGGAVHVLGVSVDVTERKRIEDELRQSEERFRLVASATNDVVWDWDLVTDAMWWSTGVLTTFGYDGDSPENTWWWSKSLDPADRERVLSGVREAIAGAGTSWRAAYRLRRADGRPADVVDRGFIIRDERGKAIRMIGALRDVTAQKHSDETLRASEERYRYLFENNPQPMWVFDEETLAFLAVNTAACRRYGYTREEFLAMTIRDIRPSEETAGLERLIASESREFQDSGVWSHRKKDGTLLEVEITSHPFLFEERPAQLVLATDITDRRRLESQLRQSQKIEAIGQLAGGIAHDFNNLLTAILGYAALLATQLPSDQILQEEVAEITRAGERAASLTRQLLAFSRRQVLEPRLLNLNDIVRNTEKMLRRLIGEHIELVAPLEPELSPVRVDAGQIEQVILNLAVNARDAMPDGGRLVIETANVAIEAADVRGHPGVCAGAYVMLAVSDNGTGMDAELQGRIFEPFFTTKSKDMGTGLGLSTVSGIVQQSGGFIATHSEVGKGTAFKVYLPKAEGVAKEIESVASDRPAGPVTETILLVEDDASLRKLARTVLTGLGYTVLDAGAGPDALDVARSHGRTIDLVLTDVIMPRMNGAEFVTALRTSRPDVAVLYMSGYTDDAMIQRNVLEEKAAFLQKPFKPATLARKIREVLDARA